MSEEASTELENKTRGSFGLRERCIAAIAFFPAVVGLSMLPLQPPAVVDANAPATEFSGARAIEHLEVIAAAPHPIGTLAHAEVRDYIVNQIAAMGLEPEVQNDTVVTELYGQPVAAKVSNVLTRIPGKNSKSAVLLMAHYDSVPNSPGASDNGAGVAVLLETLRALRAGPLLRNDVIFLFTDGEEIGLIGATAFQENHPWRSDVSLIINFEARGAGGPSIMFETSAGNSNLIEQFASFASRPVASSYSYDIYRFLPNDTDFSVFKQSAKNGLNFAFIDDLAAYHSRLDSIDRMDPRSLQHHGAYALDLSRGFGEIDFETIESGANGIYFNLPGLGLIAYSTGWALPLVAVLIVMTGVLFYLGFSRGRFSPGRVFLGLIAGPVAIGLAALTVWLVHLGLFGALVAGRGMLGSPALYRLGLALVALAVTVIVLSVVGKKLGLANLSAGAAILWLLLAVATALYLPSSSYLMSWPLLFALASLFLLLQAPKAEALPLRTGLLLLLLVVPTVLLWAPVVTLVGSAFGASAAVLLATLTGLAVSSSPLQARLLAAERRSWMLPMAILVIGLGMSLVVAAGAGHDAKRPRTNSVFYALDSVNETAIWATMDRQVDDWTSQFLPGDVQTRPLVGFFGSEPKVLAVDAPVVALSAPAITLPAPEPAPEEMDPNAPASVSPSDSTPAATPSPEEEALGAGRRLSLRVMSTRQAGEMAVGLQSKSKLTRLTIDGQEVDLERFSRKEDAPPYSWRVRLYGLAADGWQFEIELDGREPLTATAVDRAYGFPAIPGHSFEPRPAHLRPASYRPTDLSLVKTVVDF